jgi:SAM-dependent methyltransferase
MTTTPSDVAAPTPQEVYDEQYYRSHYPFLFDDPAYYALTGKFWREAIFVRNGVDPDGRILDFGCGLGQISAALPNATLFDYSDYAVQRLRKQGRRVVGRREDIPRGQFDALLSSHSLEHSPGPREDLLGFHDFVRAGGTLVLVLPVEMQLQPALSPDDNQHFYAWTFQTITNLLLSTGWKPRRQAMLYGPSGLRTLARRFGNDRGVQLAIRVGTFRKHYPAMLTVAESVGRPA